MCKVRLVAKRGNKFAESICESAEELLAAMKYNIEEEGFSINDFEIHGYRDGERTGW